MLLQVQAAQPTVQPETLFTLFSIPITNAMLGGVLVTLILAVVSLVIYKKASLIPGKFQLACELAVSSFLDLLTSITGNATAARQLLPMIGTLFIFIGLGNLIGLVPILSGVTFGDTSLIRTSTNDFNMTFSIALAMVVLTHVASLKAFGLFGHLGKFFKFKEVYLGFKSGFGAGVLAIVDFFIGLLDIVSELAKVISLSLRLFGNMYAGDVLAAILLGSLAVIVPAPWYAMNLLVGILQALVFGALTAAYYSLAVAKTEE